ncbi:MAG: shikimate dehydrogenase [Clostridia bacterium]|nr:shikimate dehydrogenase [Clostridia bacterium]
MPTKYAPQIDTRINAATRKFALLGASLPYTWSPQIHNTLLAARGVNAVYITLTVDAYSLASAVDVLRQSFAGFNVTIPYKEAIIPLLDELDDTASACGAVNTVTVSESGALTGYNTDGIGLIRALEEALVSLDDASTVIVGGGGTARIAAYELLRREGNVTVAVRDPKRAEGLVADLAALQPDGSARIQLISLEELEGGGEEYDLLINATPLGTFPDVDGCPVSQAVVARCQAVFDAVYNPPETRLLAMARAQRVKCVGGFGMLFYQAAEAQKRWLGGSLPNRVLREMHRALEQLV